MIGKYANGGGQFHLNMDPFTKIFNCKMIGSFNVKMEKSLLDYKPAFYIPDKFNHPAATGDQWFWLVKLAGEFYGWAFRWGGSRQKETVWEIISKEAFPDELKSKPIQIEVMEEWDPDKIRQWDRKQYQFQTFPWNEKPRADSELIWETIRRRADWPGAKVLDIGCNYGYHSQMASDAGACVIGFDKNENAIAQARIINDHISMNDVRFTAIFPKKVFNYVFYFSVHHQEDPKYKMLENYIAFIKGISRKKVFVELIVPALAGSMDEMGVDAIMGNQGLLKYKHKVRKHRKIYELEGAGK